MTVLESRPTTPAKSPEPTKNPEPTRSPEPAKGPEPTRRSELAAFLKACRARISPQDVGLPPGLRRRTPGLRREEVAQLAGVGVTWYTWLEQGRPINASDQVMAAVARALLLDEVQRSHLFRLAGLPAADTADLLCPTVDPTMQVILDGLSSLPAAICNRRYDILGFNAAYDALFPGATRTTAPNGRRNSLWCALTVPACCNPFLNRDDELPRMVGVLRASYASHVGEPAWEEYVRALCAVSDRFQELWESQLVAPAVTVRKVFRHASVGEVPCKASYLTIPGSPELYIVVYTPETPVARERLEWITANPHAPVVDPDHRHY